MHRQLLVVAERRQQRQRHDRALAQREAGPRPDRAPGALGDEALEIGVERVLLASARSTCASPSTLRRTFIPSSCRSDKAIAPSGSRRSARATASGASTQGMCPAPRMSSNRAPGMLSAVSRTRSGGVEPSSEPAIASVGSRRPAVDSRRSDARHGGAAADVAVDRGADQHVPPAASSSARSVRKRLGEPALQHPRLRSPRCRRRGPLRCGRPTSPRCRSSRRCSTAPSRAPGPAARPRGPARRRRRSTGRRRRAPADRPGRSALLRRRRGRP